MVVFVTPNSLRSNWLFFESGFAYSKGIRVVPVGFQGVDLSALPPPLSILQGFNISSSAGLNNLIALVNDEFECTFSESFSEEEYNEICAVSPSHSKKTFGEYSNTIHQIEIQLNTRSGLSYDPTAAINQVAALFSQEKIEFERTQNVLDAYGIRMIAYTGTHRRFEIKVDPGLADIAFPIVELAIRQVQNTGITGTEILFNFENNIGCIEDRHKLTGKFYGTEVKLAPKDHLVRGNIQFHVKRRIFRSRERTRKGKPYVIMKLISDGIPLNEICELIALLFEHQVLFFKTEDPSSFELD